MPSLAFNINYKELKKRKDIYRQKLIDKGVLDGSLKMMKLMSRKFK